MSGIEEAYAKYAKGIGEYRFNQILDRQDSQDLMIANLKKMLLDLHLKVEKNSLAISTLQMQSTDICDQEIDEENDEETRSDLEFIKQQLYENYQLLEKIDKYIRL